MVTAAVMIAATMTVMAVVVMAVKAVASSSNTMTVTRLRHVGSPSITVMRLHPSDSPS